MNETITVNKKEYTVIKLLGKGKGGYSYLVNNDGLLFTLKQIHHEPCEYYNFGNKIEAELRDYERLLQIGIMLPKLIYCDKEKEIIIKEFIDGKTIVEIIKDGEFKEDYLKQSYLYSVQTEPLQVRKSILSFKQQATVKFS